MTYHIIQNLKSLQYYKPQENEKITHVGKKGKQATCMWQTTEALQGWGSGEERPGILRPCPSLHGLTGVTLQNTYIFLFRVKGLGQASKNPSSILKLSGLFVLRLCGEALCSPPPLWVKILSDCTSGQASADGLQVSY